MEERRPLLAFSTLGCPDWDFQKITAFAAKNGYEGIEVRGLEREMDLPLCPEFKDGKNIARTRSIMKDKNLKFVDLGSSASLHITDLSSRAHHLDEAKRFIDLAHKIQCPFVRVFPNQIPHDTSRDRILALITEGLIELGDYAKESGVIVLLETHGDLMQTDDIQTIMQEAFNENTGILWDIANMWAVTREPPDAVFQRIREYIRHIHVKDFKMENGEIRYTILQQGIVPVFSAINALYENSYDGYYCFEWEKLWHEEIGDPEFAFTEYARVMRHHFSKNFE